MFRGLADVRSGFAFPVMGREKLSLEIHAAISDKSQARIAYTDLISFDLSNAEDMNTDGLDELVIVSETKDSIAVIASSIYAIFNQ